MVATTRQETLDIWRSLTCGDAVCFDVDSTVIQDEGIDEIAKYCGKGDMVREWTIRAMAGGITFRVALSERLNIICPTIKQVTTFRELNPPLMTEGICELVDTLHSRGVDVYLISGGFRCLIEPVAKRLGIPLSRVYCNRLFFDHNGNYAGFDENQPTSESGGKGRAIDIVLEENNYDRIVMIGDGATDLEASPPADAFIGFGGNVVRAGVKQNAKWFVTCFLDLKNSLESDDSDSDDETL